MTEVQPIRVLLVDDSLRFLRQETEFLRCMTGVQTVGSATSATEGLSQAVALKPDLILIDMVMPGMSGIEAIQRIKQDADAPKAVLVTLHNDQQYRAAALEAGADGFIPKQQLVETLPPLLDSLFPERQPFTYTLRCRP